jgi:hypothetical protein
MLTGPGDGDGAGFVVGAGTGAIVSLPAAGAGNGSPPVCIGVGMMVQPLAGSNMLPFTLDVEPQFPVEQPPAPGIPETTTPSAGPAIGVP